MLNSFVFPALLLLSLSLLPFPFVFGDQVESYFLPINIMMSISFVAIIFTYWTAHYYGQFQSAKKTTASILFRAVLFIVMVNGLCVHSGLAVIQGMLGHATPFVRTPKLNELAPGEKITQKSAYRGSQFSLQNMVEICLALLFVGLAVYCVSKGFYAMVPIYAFFASGYGMVSYFTLQEMRANTAAIQSAVPVKS
jgi:hypothetical protein